ncbi:MAG: RNA polymerase sigma factor [Fibrobacter sp.]|nr:RNA polymerase sigma factor [Fibrobacter sp.]
MNTESAAINQYVVEEEKTLLEQAAAGSKSAFSKLFFIHKEMVYRVVYRLLRSSDDVEDAVQQTFIEMYRSLPGYEGKSKFTTWLYRIAVNVSIQHLRKRKNGSFADIDPEILPVNGETKDSIENQELQNQISQALNSLPDKKRIVVVLHDIEERTMEEISEIIGVPLGTIKSRLFHGREEMRKKLQKVMENV